MRLDAIILKDEHRAAPGQISPSKSFQRCMLFFKDISRIIVDPRMSTCDMIDGILTINLEPAYIGFSRRHAGSSSRNSWRYCTRNEIKQVLLRFEVLPNEESNWEPQEYFAVFPCNLSEERLSEMGLN